MEFDKKDIPILDCILKELVENQLSVLPEIITKCDKNIKDVYNEFLRLSVIIEAFGCGRLRMSELYTDKKTVLIFSPKALQIKEQGGFEKIYKDLKRKDRLKYFEFTISKRKFHTFWIFLAFTVISVVLSIYNFMDSLSTLEYTKKERARIEHMESELKILRTSILNHKTHNSLHKTTEPTKTSN